MFGFRRGRRAEDGAADPLNRAVLLDNTTIFGARHAFEWDPAATRDMPSWVDLRSLMDVLEAIVLLDEFAVDASSREYYAWPELTAVSAASGSFFHDRSVLQPLGHGFHDVLIASSAEKTRRSLLSGDLVRHLGFLPTSRHLEVLPPLYRSTRQFVNLTAPRTGRPGGPTEASEAGQERLRHLADTLDQYPAPVRNFAFFAFRGFYYQDLAHLASMSYMPHSWRSDLIRGQLDHPRVRFSDFVVEEAGRLRELLRRRIDREFGAAALSGDFPLIASFVIGQAASRGELLRVAAQVRQNPKVVGFREWLRGVERSLRDESDLRAVATAQEEMRAVVREVERELGLDERGSQAVTLRFAVPLASVETTSQVSRSRQPWRDRLVTSRRPHLVFLRELTLESTRLAPFAVAFRGLAP